jgi:putative endopeptidase
MQRKIGTASSGLIVTAILLISCGRTGLTQEQAKPLHTSIDEKALDRTVDACKDFYQFACGNWIKNTSLPPGYSNWTRSFSTIQEENIKTLHGVLKSYSANQHVPETPFAKQLGDFFASCTTDAGAEQAEKNGLPKLLAKIEAIDSKSALASTLAWLDDSGVGALFDFGADQDFMDATKVVGILDRAGLGLPDKNYYFSTDPKMVSLRKAYVAYIAKLFQLGGATKTKAEGDAAQMLAFETKMAGPMLTIAERRDPSRVYHLMTQDGLHKLAPRIDWKSYLTGLGVADVAEINVTEPAFFKNINTLVDETDLPLLKTYLRWHFLAMAAPLLSQRFYDAHFDFYEKTLGGTNEQLPRWKRCVNRVSGAMGEALGQAYVKLKFDGDSKAETLKLINNIREALSTNLKQLDWMDKPTRAAAQSKLSAIFRKIGYPDQWRDYSSLVIDRSSVFENQLRVNHFETHRVLDRLGKPVDRTRWDMSPQTVNAYYNANMNEIVFPAAILQSPFYNVLNPPASNYGGIGMVMGHEMTHGFDDQGRRFDGEGNMKEWWSPEVAKAFQTRAACLVKQYDGYTVSGGVHLNGQLTLGENIADLGGIKLSFAAFQKARLGENAPIVSGFTEDQQFFVSFAQGWCSKGTPAYEQLLAQTNPHSLARYRVNGVVVNVPDFQKAFNCPAGAPMAPVDRCVVW